MQYDWKKIINSQKESTLTVKEFCRQNISVCWYYVRKCAKVAVDKTKLSEALKYSINQEEKLRVYLEDGRIEISNNRAENAIRPFCVGRRNWLFTNTVQGAQTSAALYSLIETAKLNNLNPYEYFNYLLSSLTEIDINDEEALDNYMPWSKELPDNTYLTKKS